MSNKYITWLHHYFAMLEYEKQYGDCNVTKAFKETNYECLLRGMGENGTDYHYSAKLGKTLILNLRNA